MTTTRKLLPLLLVIFTGCSDSPFDDGHETEKAGTSAKPAPKLLSPAEKAKKNRLGLYVLKIEKDKLRPIDAPKILADIKEAGFTAEDFGHTPESLARLERSAWISAVKRQVDAQRKSPVDAKDWCDPRHVQQFALDGKATLDDFETTVTELESLQKSHDVGIAKREIEKYRAGKSFDLYSIRFARHDHKEVAIGLKVGEFAAIERHVRLQDALVALKELRGATTKWQDENSPFRGLYKRYDLIASYATDFGYADLDGLDDHERGTLSAMVEDAQARRRTKVDETVRAQAERRK